MYRGGLWVSVSSIVLLALFPALGLDAQTYPAKAVRMITTSAPGGSVDIVARILGQKMTENMGQQVIVDSRPGAGGSVGTVLAVRAPADGYTIIMQTIPLVVNPSLYRKLPFDVIRDLAPVSLIAAAPFVLVVHPSVPAKSVKDLIALAKRQPGKLNYSSGVIGTNSHIAAELFKNLTGTNIVQVPYKGGGAALVAVVNGESDLGFLGVVAVVPHVKTGRMRALGVTSTKRSSTLPELPTIAQAGVPGYEFTSWYGVLAPAGTPASIINTLNDHVVKAMRAPDVAEHLAKEGADVIASSPEQFASHIKVELARYAKLVKEAGLRAD